MFIKMHEILNRPPLFSCPSPQPANWWIREFWLWSRPPAVLQQVRCSLWQMRCTSLICSSRGTGTGPRAPPASSTPAPTGRATPWLPVRRCDSTTSCSLWCRSCTGRSSSSSTRATTVSSDCDCVNRSLCERRKLKQSPENQTYAPALHFL